MRKLRWMLGVSRKHKTEIEDILEGKRATCVTPTMKKTRRRRSEQSVIREKKEEKGKTRSELISAEDHKIRRHVRWEDGLKIDICIIT